MFEKGILLMKCLIIDVVSSVIATELDKYMEVDTKILPTQAELAAIIGDYEILIMRVDPAINKEILDAAKKLKVIGVCSVGLNHIDLNATKEKGIQVFNLVSGVRGMWMVTKSDTFNSSSTLTPLVAS